jgi:hypothetical protein
LYVQTHSCINKKQQYKTGYIESTEEDEERAIERAGEIKMFLGFPRAAVNMSRRRRHLIRAADYHEAKKTTFRTEE